MPPAPKSQPGIIPVGALYQRPSACADAARLRMIEAELSLTADQRIVKALRLGFRDRELCHERSKSSR